MSGGMHLALANAEAWLAVGFHAAVFVAVVVVLVAVQWLFDRRR